MLILSSRTLSELCCILELRLKFKFSPSCHKNPSTCVQTTRIVCASETGGCIAKQTLDHQGSRESVESCFIGGGARVISRVRGGDRTDAQDRAPLPQGNDINPHVGQNGLPVEDPSEQDGSVALGDAAGHRHNLVGVEGPFAEREGENAGAN